MPSQIYRVMATRVLLCLLLAGSAGCSWLQAKPKQLLTRCSDSQLYVAQQQWQLSHAQQQYLLQVVIERGADHWQWILMDSLGQRLVTASAKDGEVAVQQQRSHPALKFLPELLDAWQASYWPLTDLQQHNSEGWSFKGDAAHRELWFSGIVRATIAYQNESPWMGAVHYVDRHRQLDLIIESQLLNTP